MKKHHLVIVFVFLILTSVTAKAETVNTNHTPLNDRTRAFNISNTFDTQQVPNLSFVVRKNEETFGPTVFSLSGQEKADEQVVFEAASLGKMVTAYLAMILIEEEIIALDDKVYLFIDETWKTNPAIEQVTLRMLLSHTAGFSNTIIPLDKEIYTPPGVEFNYSGVGYVLIQHYLEVKTGHSFEELTNQYVFQPLEMEHSSFITTPALFEMKLSPHVTLKTTMLFLLIPSLVVLLGLSALTFFVTLKIKQSSTMKQRVSFVVILSIIIETLIFAFMLPRFLWLNLILWTLVLGILFFMYKISHRNWPGIVLVSTVLVSLFFMGDISVPLQPDSYQEANAAYTFHTTSADLDLFAQKLTEDYQKAYLAPMFTAQVDIDSNNSWSCGLGIETYHNETAYWHWGSNMGFKSLFVIDPDKKFHAIMLTNSDTGAELTRQLAKTFYHQAFEFQLAN